MRRRPSPLCSSFSQTQMTWGMFAIGYLDLKQDAVAGMA